MKRIKYEDRERERDIRVYIDERKETSAHGNIYPNSSDDEYLFFSDFVTATAAWPRQEQPCPIAGDFCMNGGTCLFFETVGEPACR